MQQLIVKKHSNTLVIGKGNINILHLYIIDSLGSSFSMVTRKYERFYQGVTNEQQNHQIDKEYCDSVLKKLWLF